MRRSDRKARLTAFQAGLLAIVLIALVSYLGSTKDIPFTRPFELKAVFNNAQNIQQDSPVRIAGVEVGKVSRIEAADDDAEATVVTMKIQDKALPIHKDARVKIRPRIFLEGNFFVDIKPGRPDAGKVGDGDTIPATQTSAPVQIDEVLGTLQSDARTDLQKLLRGYGDALAAPPTPAEDADQDPATQGETAGESLNDSLRYSADALRGTALVNQALLGTELHDLSKLVAGGQRVSAALASREEQLKDLVTNFNLTTGALAAEQGALRESVRRLPGVIGAARSALDNLNRAFPPTRAFARELIPGVRETPATIEASFPWIRQTRRLVSKPELQGLVADLQPAVDDLAQTIDGAEKLLPRLDDASLCFSKVVIPTLNVRIQDGGFTTNIENYKEFFQALVGLAGESQNFDGNGSYTRFQTGGGSNLIKTDPLPSGTRFGNATRPPLGTRPARPAQAPPYKRDLACHRNTPPDLNSARTGSGP